jgi:hypothetical protein
MFSDGESDEEMSEDEREVAGVGSREDDDGEEEDYEDSEEEEVGAAGANPFAVLGGE